MDTIYIMLAVLIMGISSYVQYRFVTVHTMYILPFIFAILTFWIGFLALLFAFALIFIAQLSPQHYQSDTTDVLKNLK